MFNIIVPNVRMHNFCFFNTFLFSYILGVYISENSYVRIGEQGFDSCYKPFYIVEYFKYLRFFTDGKD